MTWSFFPPSTLSRATSIMIPSGTTWCKNPKSEHVLWLMHQHPINSTRKISLEGPSTSLSQTSSRQSQKWGLTKKLWWQHCIRTSLGTCQRKAMIKALRAGLKGLTFMPIDSTLRKSVLLMEILPKEKQILKWRSCSSQDLHLECWGQPLRCWIISLLPRMIQRTLWV